MLLQSTYFWWSRSALCEEITLLIFFPFLLGNKLLLGFSFMKLCMYMCVFVTKFWHVSKLPSCFYSQLHVHKVYCFHSSVEVWQFTPNGLYTNFPVWMDFNRIWNCSWTGDIFCVNRAINRKYPKFQVQSYYSLSAISFCSFYALASLGSSLARTHRGHGEVKYIAMCFLIDMYWVFLKGSTMLTGKSQKC